MDRWNHVSHVLTHFAGSKRVFALAVALVVVWGAAGVFFEPTRTWELIITCGVPIVTLLLVIVLQHAQNRDTKAVELKLNELLLALDEPDSRLIKAGRLGDEELDDLRESYDRQA